MEICCISVLRKTLFEGKIEVTVQKGKKPAAPTSSQLFKRHYSVVGFVG